MPDLTPQKNSAIYTGFQTSVAELECGHKCAPYSENTIPFCCDTRYMVPIAFISDWDYLKANTDLWHLWVGENPEESAELRADTPGDQILIICLGHKSCQHEFRLITCRAFSFFPYFDSKQEYLRLTYYCEYEDRSWVISDLQVIHASYLQAFIKTYELLFEGFPMEVTNYDYYSTCM